MTAVRRNNGHCAGMSSCYHARIDEQTTITAAGIEPSEARFNNSINSFVGSNLVISTGGNTVGGRSPSYHFGKIYCRLSAEGPPMDRSRSKVHCPPVGLLKNRKNRLGVLFCSVFVLLVPLLQFRSTERSTTRSSLVFQPGFNASVDENALEVTSRRPVLVLHVGPMKTGTTTIQCQLRDLEKKGILQRHRIGLLETESCRPRGPSLNGQVSYDNLQRGHAFIPNCLLKWTPTLGGMPKCWNVSYYRVLQEANQNRSAPQDFIISNEILMKVFVSFRNDSALFVRDLTKSLREAGNYRLEVVATYRHWHEWIASVYQQRYRLVPTGKPKLLKYPGDGGERVPSLQDFVRQAAHSEGEELVHHVLEFFESAGRRHDEMSETDVGVSLVNIHGLPSFEHNFFCEGLPPTMAPAFDICDAGQSNRLIPHAGSGSRNYGVGDQRGGLQHNAADRMLIMYDTLVLDARLRGWFPPTVTRTEAMLFLRSHFLKHKTPSGGSTSSWPMVCPDREFMSKIHNKSQANLNKTLTAWKELDGRLGGKGGWLDINGWGEKQFQDDLEGRLSRVIASHQFCSIDSDATLNQNETTWRELFTELGRRCQHVAIQSKNTSL